MTYTLFSACSLKEFISVKDSYAKGVRMKGEPLKAYEVLLAKGIEKCEECHNPVSDDWEFKDWTSKTVVICPQCKTEYYTEDN